MQHNINACKLAADLLFGAAAKLKQYGWTVGSYGMDGPNSSHCLVGALTWQVREAAGLGRSSGYGYMRSLEGLMAEAWSLAFNELTHYVREVAAEDAWKFATWATCNLPDLPKTEARKAAPEEDHHGIRQRTAELIAVNYSSIERWNDGRLVLEDVLVALCACALTLREGRVRAKEDHWKALCDAHPRRIARQLGAIEAAKEPARALEREALEPA